MAIQPDDEIVTVALNAYWSMPYEDVTPSSAGPYVRQGMANALNAAIDYGFRYAHVVNDPFSQPVGKKHPTCVETTRSGHPRTWVCGEDCPTVVDPRDAEIARLKDIIWIVTGRKL